MGILIPKCVGGGVGDVGVGVGGEGVGMGTKYGDGDIDVST